MATTNYVAKIDIVGNETPFDSQITKILQRDYKVNVKMGTETVTTTGYNKFGQVITNIEQGAKGANKELISTNATTHKLNQSFTSILGKVVKFGAATAIIGLFTTGITQAVQSVKEFDDSLTQFKKVSNLSGSALDSYTKKLGKTGIEVGRTRAEMVDAATEFKKSGFNDEDSAKLAKVAT